MSDINLVIFQFMILAFNLYKGTNSAFKFI